MSTTSSHGPEGPRNLVTVLPDIAAQDTQAVVDAASPASRGGPEGRYVAGPGKPVTRQVSDLQDQRSEAAVKVEKLRGGVERAESTDKERKENHRGGDRTWLLRALILVLVLAEAVTAYV